MKIEKSHLITISFLLAVLLLVGGATFWFVYQKKHAVIEETAAIFTNQPGELPYTDLIGNPVALDQYLGKVLVVVSWASWSPFSQADLSMLVELAKEYPAEKVAFMAINRKETKDQAMRYVGTLSPLDGIVVAIDQNDNFYAAVGGYAMPETVIFDQRGEIIEHLRVVSPKAEIKTAVDRLIAE
jgi:thiol-disulfide isomerase/thioredoxin